MVGGGRGKGKEGSRKGKGWEKFSSYPHAPLPPKKKFWIWRWITQTHGQAFAQLMYKERQRTEFTVAR